MSSSSRLALLLLGSILGTTACTAKATPGWRRFPRPLLMPLAPPLQASKQSLCPADVFGECRPCFSM